MILILDNYDSFTYNLYQMLGSITPDLEVSRNDALTVADIRSLAPDGIVISPGPGRPEDAGICPDVIRELRGEIPIFGVCLGEQAIGQVYGANVTYARQLMHGKQSRCKLDLTSPLFRGLPEEILVARYHSLCVDRDSILQLGGVDAVPGIGTAVPASGQRSETDQNPAASAAQVSAARLTITGETEAQEVMAIEDRENRVYGVQFHPESIMTPEGSVILQNFVELARGE